MSGTGGVAHEDRVDVLVALATLVGAAIDLRWLPDGTEPDVLRFSPQRHLLFVGEAKDTEHPRGSETMVRLARYLTWVISHARSGRIGILVLCCPRATTTPWSGTITCLARELGWSGCVPSVRPMGGNSGVVTAVFAAGGSTSRGAGNPRADDLEDPRAVLMDPGHPGSRRLRVSGALSHAARVEYRPSPLA